MPLHVFTQFAECTGSTRLVQIANRIGLQKNLPSNGYRTAASSYTVIWQRAFMSQYVWIVQFALRRAMV
jgi:hypothetical protein